MKKIIFITTGGTIACSDSAEGLVPTMPSDELYTLIGKGFENCDVVMVDLMQLDSSNMQPEEWQMMAEEIAKHIPYADGIVLTHGTDTMAYTASALSFMLANLPIPVVLTGSQLPIQHPLSDGIENIRCAITMAMQPYGGVFIAFNRKILLGSRAVKVRTMGFDAFDSVNSTVVASIDARGMVVNAYMTPKSHGYFQVKSNLCTDVFLIKLTPGFNPNFFDALINMHYRGIVIEAFGAGGLAFIRRDLISKLQQVVDQGISVVVCSQCLYDGSNFSIYQTGQKALQKGVIEGFDMTTEAAVTKLMWILGNSETPLDVKKAFQTNYVNEITLPSL